MTRAVAQTIDNPFFARVWPVAAAHEADSIRTLRRRTWPACQAGYWKSARASGPLRLLSAVGRAGGRHRARTATGRPGNCRSCHCAGARGRDRSDAEEFGTGQQFDAVVCSFVLCSVCDPAGSCSICIRSCCGGELRYLEHVASAGARGRWQRFLDATVWPRSWGTATRIEYRARLVDAGFEVRTSRREWSLPVWSPMPVSELALGRARRVL